MEALILMTVFFKRIEIDNKCNDNKYYFVLNITQNDVYSQVYQVIIPQIIIFIRGKF